MMAGMLRRALLGLLGLFSLSLAAGCGKDAGGASTGSASTTGAKIKVAVIPKGTTHEFWKAVHAGAAKAAKETGVQIMW